MERTFTINAKEVKLTDGRSFIKCTAVINGKWVKVKFKKACEQVPKTKGIYNITVTDENLSLQKGRTAHTDDREFTENGTLWVEACTLRKWSDEEMQAKQKVKIDELFGTTEE